MLDALLAHASAGGVRMLIIDCHGHYTTAPEPHQKFRDAQLVRIKDSTLPAPVPRASATTRSARSIETNQLRAAARARRRPHAVLAARLGHGASRRR